MVDSGAAENVLPRSMFHDMSTEADVRRLCVSAFRIKQANSDVSIGKNEAIHHEQEEGEIGAQQRRQRVCA